MSQTRAAAVLTFVLIAMASRRCVEARAALYKRLYLLARTPLLLLSYFLRLELFNEGARSWVTR